MTMRPWQANIIGAGVAGLVLGGGLVLGAPDAVANGPSRPQTLGALPQVGDDSGELPLGDSIQMWGRPSRLSLFWTSDPTDKIVQTYVDAWTAAGMPPRVMTLDKVTAVTALDASDGPSAGLARSVTIVDQGEDRLVMPGLSDMSVPADITPRHAPVPVPSNAIAYMGQTADDAGAVSYNGSFKVPMSFDRVIEFYEQELAKEHYKVRAAKKKVRGGATIEFERDSEWISIIAHTEELNQDPNDKRPGGPLAAAQVSVTHVRTITPKAEWKP